MIVIVFIALAGIGLLAIDKILAEIDDSRAADGASTSPEGTEAPDAWLFADGAFQ